MRKLGTVVRWDEAKGFGFIHSPQANAQLFFHIRDWRGDMSPTVQQRVNFEEIHVGGKGPRAMDVRPEGRPTRASAPTPEAKHVQRPMVRPVRSPQSVPISRRTSSRGQQAIVWPAFALMLTWAALLVTGVILDRISWQLLPATLLLNLITFYLYWQDKFAATRGAWRTAENTLHLFGLIGGWPGAWFAHQVLRHKSSKQAFRRVYWITAIMNVTLLCIWMTVPRLPQPV